MTEQSRADLLVELGCEELPPKVLGELAQAFFDGTCAGLQAAGLAFDQSASRYYYTPRRMSLLLAGVPGHQADRRQERRGPAVSAAFKPDGTPTPAAEGFARSVGKTVAELERVETDKGAWLTCTVELPGQPLPELLFPLLAAALDGLPVPKPMRWGDHDYRFIRPVHWLLVLHGEQVLAGELFGCPAGRLTRGHRIHAPGPHPVQAPANYLEVLRMARVEADPSVRQARIRDAAVAAGTAAGGETRITEALLREVANLVEWPQAVLCNFDPAFLEVPQEALIASMETHQKFFPVFAPGGQNLGSAFVAIANLESADPDAVRSGYERVIRPRLADARFFWNQDLKRGLSTRSDALDSVVFQEKLGTIGDKVNRIAEVCGILSARAEFANAHAETAARICKNDLVSAMVGEFPELQGTMGGHYARAAGMDPAVAEAIATHYWPRFAGDRIPTSLAGRLLAVADRMDTLVGGFAAGLKPSGNKDPFALRRAALGVIRILLESPLALRPAELISLAANSLAPQIEVPEQVRAEVLEFMLERLRNHLLEDGGLHTSRQVAAVLAAPLDTLPDLQARLNAVSRFMAGESAPSLVAANKRIGNILKKQDAPDSRKIDENALVLAEERLLFEELKQARARVEPLIEKGEYEQALASLAILRPAVDGFFEQVMVMDEDLIKRNNRLALLASLKAMFDDIADFSMAD